MIGNLDASSVMSGSVQGWWLWAPCAANWPAKSADRYTGPWDTKTKEPILLIGTRYDPNTAYRNAVRSQLLLGNAVLLTHQGYGHLSFNDPSACIEAGTDGLSRRPSGARTRHRVPRRPAAVQLHIMSRAQGGSVSSVAGGYCRHGAGCCRSQPVPPRRPTQRRPRRR